MTYYPFGSSKFTRTPNENLPSATVFIERAIFGAVGGVIWWVVPLVLFGISWYWLFLTSLYIGAVVGMIVEVIFGTSSNTLYFILEAGPYVGGAIGGATLGWGLGAFVAGMAKELGGKKPRVNKLYTNIGVIVGAIYGIFFAWNYIINGFMNFPD